MMLPCRLMLTMIAATIFVFAPRARAASLCQARFAIEEVGMRLRNMDGYADHALLADTAVWALDFIDVSDNVFGDADSAGDINAAQALIDCNCSFAFTSLVCSFVGACASS